MEIQFEKYIRNTLEAKELGNAYQFVFDKIENEGQRLIDNQFIYTADEHTLLEWENFLGIPFDNTLSIDERRQQILLRLNLKPPYTMNNIRRQISSIVGHEVYVFLDYGELLFRVETAGLEQNTLTLIESLLKRVLPVNVVYMPSSLIDATTTSYYGCVTNQATIYDNYAVLTYNKWSDYASDTWQDVLNKGTWMDVLVN